MSISFEIYLSINTSISLTHTPASPSLIRRDQTLRLNLLPRTPKSYLPIIYYGFNQDCNSDRRWHICHQKDHQIR